MEDILAENTMEMTSEKKQEVCWLSDYRKKLRTSVLSFKRNEFTVEVSTQLVIQTLMLLLSQTGTATNQGLQAVFRKDTTAFLVISVLWSFSTTSRTYIKIKSEKKQGFVPIAGAVILGVRALAVSVTRILCLLAFFGPFLGLLNSLAHWKAEKISLDLQYRKKWDQAFNISTSVLTYHNKDTDTADEVRFSDIFRSDYSDPNNPVPPGYEAYTLVTLRSAYIGLAVILMLQCLSILAVKIKQSDKFYAAKKSGKFSHIIETLNFPDCYGDWDEGDGSSEEHRERYKKARKEMLAMIGVQFIFNLVLLSPVFVTGQ